MSEVKIYAITNLENGRQYVGVTSIALSARWSIHKSKLRSSSHPNDLLQIDWDEYGPDVFTCEVLDIVDKKESDVMEKKWTVKLHAYYNLEKLDKNGKKPLHSLFTRSDIEQLKKVAKSLGFKHAGNGSIYKFLRAVIDGDVKLRIDKKDSV